MSTDKQSADSPADQIARCREFAASRGWRVVDALVVEDAGISGASRHNRPRLLELIARIDEWDVLLCYDYSRLARDSEDLGWIRNRLLVHRRTAYEASTGLDIFNVGARVMGVINEEYLIKLRADVQRGLRGRVERDFFAGGTPYGYRTEPVPSGRTDAHGQSIPAGYRLVLDPAQAVVVRRIFDLYARGEGQKAIAHRLNAEAVPPPRPRGMKRKGASWSPTAIRQILLNPLYKGEYIWNRSEWIKDHETGRRKRHARPEREWVRRTSEEWTIVEPALWERAQAARAAKAHAYPRAANGTVGGERRNAQVRRRGRSLLAGYCECGVCGGGFFDLHGRDWFGCAWRRDRGPDVCASTLRVPRAALEERFFGALRQHVLTPENVLRAVEKALDVVERGLAEAPAEADRERLAKVEGQIENLIRLAAEVGHLDAHRRVLAELEEERAALRARLNAAGPPLAFDRAALRAAAEARVLAVREALGADLDRGRATLRTLLGEQRIRVAPDEARGFRMEGVFALGAEVDRPGGPNGALRAGRTGGSGGGI